MRIAFDIDNTLIPQGRDFPAYISVPWPLRVWWREPLRDGAVPLLRDLQRAGHDVWLYTTSGRGESYLRAWFWALGIRLGGVVNWHRHEALRRANHCPNCSKYPPAFQIDLLVDDSDGVALEGRQYGFAVLLVDPADADWTTRVRTAAGLR